MDGSGGKEGTYFDDPDLAGDFEDDVFIFGHFDIALPNLKMWILMKFAGINVALM